MTTPLVIPALKRIFTVGGGSTETVELPIQWGFNTRLLSGFVGDRRGEWYPWNHPGAELTAASLVTYGASGYSFASLAVESDGSLQSGVPQLLDVVTLEDENHWMRLTTVAAGSSYVQIPVSRITLYADSLDFRADTGLVLVGDDFDLSPATYVLMSLENHTSEQSTTTVSGKPVWGDLLERGSQLGVISIGAETPVTTGSEETASAIIRYDAGLALGTMLIDDLGREWTIRGSRTLQDRRYLEFDMFRIITAG